MKLTAPQDVVAVKIEDVQYDVDADGNIEADKERHVAYLLEQGFTVAVEAAPAEAPKPWVKQS